MKQAAVDDAPIWRSSTRGLRPFFALCGLLLLSANCRQSDTSAQQETGALSRNNFALTASCNWVPSEWTDPNNEESDCDCPLDGNRSCDPDCAAGNTGSHSIGDWCGCDYCFEESGSSVDFPPPGWEPSSDDEPAGGGDPATADAGASSASCDWVPSEYVDSSDGCDCPYDGNTACDPDCAGGGGQAWCGCDFCYDEHQQEVSEDSAGAADPPPSSNPAVECDWVPQEYVSAGDGCDCPLNGETSCDPDCSSNGGSAWCGCDFCYDETQTEVETDPDADTAPPPAEDPPNQAAPRETNVGFSISVAADRLVEDFVLSAAQTLTIGEDAMLLRPMAPTWDKIARTASGGDTIVGARSTIGHTDALGQVTLDSDVIGVGGVRTAQGVVDNPTAGISHVTSRADISLTQVSWTIQFPTQEPAPRSIVDGEVLLLSPGDYGDVTAHSGSQLILSAGLVQF